MIGSRKHESLVDDMETVRQCLADVFGEDGFLVMKAEDGIQALWEMERRHRNAWSRTTRCRSMMDSTFEDNVEYPSPRH